MDINIAKTALNTLIQTRTDELGALSLAYSILTNTFKAEFTNRDQAVAEVTEKTAAIAEMNTTLTNLQEANTTLQAEKTNLETANTELQTQVEAATVVAEPVTIDPAPAEVIN